MRSIDGMVKHVLWVGTAYETGGFCKKWNARNYVIFYIVELRLVRLSHLRKIQRRCCCIPNTIPQYRIPTSFSDRNTSLHRVNVPVFLLSKRNNVEI